MSERKATQSVSFTADGECEDGLAVQDDDTLVFKNVVNNEGGGYDAASGTFTAPVAGTYSFTVSVTAAKGGWEVRARIWGDGGIDVWLRGSDTSTGSGTVGLQAGGRVRVWTRNSADEFNGKLSSFSGKLQSVAFTADGQNGLAKQGDTLVFKNVVNNEGDGYDAAFSTFTAPVAGTYTFTASVRAKAGRGAMAAYIRGDGGIHGWLWGTETSTGTGTATARLQAGWRVWVGTAYPASQFEGLCSSFSGALISPKV